MGTMIAVLVAAFFGYRLWQVLGRRDESGQSDGMARPPRPDPFARVPEMMRRTPIQPVAVPLDMPGAMEPADEFMSLDATLKRLKQLDPAFDEKSFLAGAKQAFHLVLSAYNSGDLSPVDSLLGEDVKRAFSAGLATRRQGETVEAAVQSLTASIDSARLTGTVARLTVGFHSIQTSVTKDFHGTLLSGDPKRPEEMEDYWSFVRDTRATDPNWKLVETHHRG